MTIAAGDTRRTWSVDGSEQFLEFGEEAGFDGDSLDVEVLWQHEGEWTVADETYVTRTPVDEDDCDTPSPSPSETPAPGAAGGGELPQTGSPLPILGGAGAVALASGGLLLWSGRRRRGTVR